jgi:predicted site-specific integrase-resolvase/DNA-binding CsgD family transcriptional regulator
VNLADWAASVGVNRHTAYRWFREGTLPVPAERVGRLILVKAAGSASGSAATVVVYARVSSHDQRSDLDRQVARLTGWATGRDLEVGQVVCEVGSGLNGKRPKLRRILSDPDARVIVVEHRDRLARFGVEHRLGVRYCVPHTTALGMRGSTGEAPAALAALDRQRRPFRSLDYERSLARAWAAANQGAVSEAITVLLSAAEGAAATGQFAAEVICRQTAAQLGDHSSAARLRELEAIVEGPRVGLAARFAAALRDGDAAELSLVSEEFERMGDSVAAVDAALTYRRHGQRGSALGCSTRAGALAERCGCVATPELRRATEPLPLTGREREVVMLIGEGLSNRDVAARLTVSVRTVESHIHQAMSKTGTGNRDELAALLPRHKAAK